MCIRDSTSTTTGVNSSTTIIHGQYEGSEMDVTVASFPSPPRPRAVSVTEEAAWGVPITRHFDGTSTAAPSSSSATTLHHQHQRAATAATTTPSVSSASASPPRHSSNSSYEEDDSDEDEDEDDDGVDILSPLHRAALWR
eukprot:TRINITY_DN6256_c0_g1_i6.p1 TRINITY_DN6256_c0_g1~~TRINITY_DN6256_c0_g1_i6.p1  ORF type:complete len:140 (-),score=33.62 TRINITY_DN6256_c0_g1_i6:291-710(-)